MTFFLTNLMWLDKQIGIQYLPSLINNNPQPPSFRAIEEFTLEPKINLKTLLTKDKPKLQSMVHEFQNIQKIEVTKHFTVKLDYRVSPDQTDTIFYKVRTKHHKYLLHLSEGMNFSIGCCIGDVPQPLLLRFLCLSSLSLSL